MTEQPDIELVQAAMAGDVDSLGQLYCRHYRALVGVAYCVLADRQLAEDAAQEAFVIACRDLARLRCAQTFPSWIRTITRRVAGRMARSRREGKLPEEVPARPESPLEEHSGNAVHEAVMRLPRAAREVVVLHYFSGLSHKQIAVTLGISPEAVHGRLVRARRRLAGKLRHLVPARAET